jgi:hypothetical protein
MTVPGPRATRLQPGAYRWCRCDAPNALCPAEAACAGVDFTVERARTVGLCRCGRTRTPPECDGSHAVGRPGLLWRLVDRLRR